MVRTTETKCPLCGTLWEVEFGDGVAQTIPVALRCTGCRMRRTPTGDDFVVRGEIPAEMAGDEEATQMIVDSLVHAALADLAEDAAAPIDRKCRVYQFSVPVALQVLKTGFDLSDVVVSAGFPSDAQYVRGWVDESTQVVNLLVQSKAFTVNEDGAFAPSARLEFKRRGKSGCCGSIGFDGKTFTCSNGATGEWHDEELTVTLPGCKPFKVLTADGEIALFGLSAAWVAMRAVNVVSPEVACSILDVPGGYAAVKLPE